VNIHAHTNIHACAHSQPVCSPELEKRIKVQLQRAVAVKEGVPVKDSNLARALRRRIDFVASAAEAAVAAAAEPQDAEAQHEEAGR